MSNNNYNVVHSEPAGNIVVTKNIEIQYMYYIKVYCFLEMLLSEESNPNKCQM